jgi:hypothetical protein
MLHDKTTPSPRSAVLVLGMHRSGTSAIARTLNLMGCDLPKTLLPPNEHNSPGYWESDKIYEFNNRLLASCDSNWRDWRPFESSRLSTLQWHEQSVTAADLLRTEFGGSDFFVLKDPRICRLFPFWKGVLTQERIDVNVVFPVRSLREVAASLYSRNHVHVQWGMLLWLRHVLDAENSSRHLSRCFVNYESLLHDGAGQAKRIHQQVSAPWKHLDQATSEAICAFLSTEHRHHQHPPELSGKSHLDHWLTTTLQVVGRWAADDEDDKDYATLDAVRAEFDQFSESTGALFNSINQEKEEQLRRVAELRTKQKNQNKVITELETSKVNAAQTLERNSDLAQVLTQEFVHLRSRDEQKAQEITRLRAERDAGAEECKKLEAANLQLADDAKRDRNGLGNVSKQLIELSGHRTGLREEAREFEKELSDAVRGELNHFSGYVGKHLDSLSQQGNEQRSHLAELTDRLQSQSVILTELQHSQGNAIQLLTTGAEFAPTVAQELAHLRNQREQLTDETARLQTELDERVEEVRQLAAENLQLADNAEHDKTQVRTLSSRHRELTEERERLHAESASLREILQQARQTQSDLSNELRVVSAAHGQLREEITNWKDRSEKSAQESSRAIEGQRRIAKKLEKRIKEEQLAHSTHTRFKDLALKELHEKCAIKDTEFRDISTRLKISEDCSKSLNMAHELMQQEAIASKRLHLQTIVRLGELEAQLAGHRTRSQGLLLGVNVPFLGTERALRSRFVYEEQLLKKSELFNGDWYLLSNPDVRQRSFSAEYHYLHFGAAELRDSGPDFSTRRYLEANPDVAAEGVNPLIHYLQFGVYEGRAVHPGGESALIETSPLFERDWYLQAYPEVEREGTPPREHYFEFGKLGTHDPGPNFSSALYLEANPDVEDARRNPLLHYEQFGKNEGREIFPSTHSIRQAEPPPPLTVKAEDAQRSLEHALKTISCSQLFDKDWYLDTYADVRNLGVDPAEHYLAHGCDENRDPGPEFSGNYYSASNPDIGSINPLLHYEIHGRSEGRGIGVSRLARVALSGEYIHNEGRLAPPPRPLAATLNTVVADAVMSRPLAGLHFLSVSIGRLPRPSGAVREVRRCLQAFCRLYGIGEELPEELGLAQPDNRNADVADLLDLTRHRCSDIYWASKTVLRLRVDPGDRLAPDAAVLTAYQYSSSNTTLVNVGQLRLGDAPMPDTDLELVSPFSPLLLVTTTDAGEIHAASILPFPSLCRNGTHFPELGVHLTSAGYLSTLRDYGSTCLTKLNAALTSNPGARHQVRVDSTDALGTEVIFGTFFLDWLQNVMKSQLIILPPGQGDPCLTTDFFARGKCDQAIAFADRDDPDRRGGVSARAVPTISALCSREAVLGSPMIIATTCSDESFIVADNMPAPGFELALIPASPHHSEVPIAEEPTMIMMADPSGESEPLLMLPFSINTFDRRGFEAQHQSFKVSVVVVVHSKGLQSTAATLASIRSQACSEVSEVFLIKPYDLPIKTRDIETLGGNIKVVDASAEEVAETISQVAEGAANERVVLVSDAVDLPDPRSLAHLGRLCDDPATVMVTCQLITETSLGKLRTVGAAPSGMLLRIAADGTSCYEPTSSLWGVQRRTILPVAAVLPALVVFKKTEWSALRPATGMSAVLARARTPANLEDMMVLLGELANLAGHSVLCSHQISAVLRAPSNTPKEPGPCLLSERDRVYLRAKTVTVRDR